MAARLAFFLITIAFMLINTYATHTTTERLYHEIQFSYSGATGPANWGSLSPTCSACSNGKLQSPIDIVKDKAVVNKSLKPLNRYYYPANATLVNNGFNVAMRYEANAGVLVLDDKNYSLVQMHWHSPSEHRIDGLRYDAELHLVHKADDDNISVVAVLYQYGHADPLVAKIQNKLGELAKEMCAKHEQAHIALGTYDTRQMRRATHSYYRYVGSLTTPPCSENVVWNILGKVRSISREQVKALKAPLYSTCKNNSRPVQALDGRQIQLYNGLT